LDAFSWASVKFLNSHQIWSIVRPPPRVLSQSATAELLCYANLSVNSSINYSIDDAFLLSDQAAVDMAHCMLRNEGMFIGSSSAMNLVGAAMAAQQLPENSVIVTIVCDSR